MNRFVGRWIAAAMCAVMLVVLAAPVGTARAAEGELPFELEAPSGVKAEFQGSSSDPSACKVSYTKNASMAEWLAKDDKSRKEALKKLGYSELSVFAQIDWAIDSPSDWKYSDKWDNDTGRASVDAAHPDEYVLGDWAYVKMNCTKEATDTALILRDMGNPGSERDAKWNDGKNGAYSVGWKSVLKTSQYTVVNSHVKIDFESHTLFVRVRYGVALKKEGETKATYVFSDWSSLSAYGKDADHVEYHLSEYFDAPQVFNPRFKAKVNGHGPFVVLSVNVPDTVADAIAKVTEAGGYVQIVTQGRIKDPDEEYEWVDLVGGELEVATGDAEWDISGVEQPKHKIGHGTEVELRSQYFIVYAGNEYESAFSEVTTLLVDENTMIVPVPEEGDITPTPTPRPTPIPSWMLSGKNSEEKSECSLCGMCPVQPLGVCLFLWMGGFVVVLILFAIIKHLIKNIGSKKVPRRKG
ncbi:MAG: hypothetical protein J5645_04135 [Lachnospiraceae bacterium]|nr:hypothetical protein [Lachnospiraceae bacterium]